MTKARSNEVWPRSSLGGVSRQIVLVASGLGFSADSSAVQCRCNKCKGMVAALRKLAPFLLGPVRLRAAELLTGLQLVAVISVTAIDLVDARADRDVLRQQFIDAVDRLLGDTLEHVAQIEVGIHGVEQRAADHNLK